MSARVARVAAALAAAALLIPGGASAYYGNGARIVSADYQRLEQGDDASSFGDVSQDGRHVVFQTRARNLFPDADADPPGQFRRGGVFRHDLATRTLELVADGDLYSESNPDELLVRGAESPSVSADGRFVAFSTGQRLVAQDTNNNVDVYVRDMQVPLTPGRAASGAYELVSAPDGSAAAAAYEPRDPPQPGREFGSETTPGASISADGRRVVFRTRRASNLPTGGPPSVPAFQVLVRDLDTLDTELITRRSGDGAPAGGARNVTGISADGSTVVWAGANAQEQTRFLNGENTDPSLPYYLWSRVGAPAGQTRRITGMADPEDPACAPGSTISQSPSVEGPCYGPLTGTEQGFGGGDISSLLPTISADGDRLAFLTGAGPRPLTFTGAGLDLFHVDMTAPSRKAGTVELTREGAAGDQSASSPIDQLVGSPGGGHVAIVTRRTQFLLPALTFVGARRAFPDARDLYVIDLNARTIERALRGLGGADIDGDVAGVPSIADGAGRVAFASAASNLFFGDANGVPDVFDATRQAEPGPEPPPAEGSGPAADPPQEFLSSPPRPRLRVSARSLPDGAVQLTVRVPGSGRVRADVAGRVGKPKRSRRLARVDRRVGRAGVLRLKVALAPRYRSLARRRGGFAGRAAVTFTARRGGRRVPGSVRVVFKAKRPQRGGKR